DGRDHELLEVDVVRGVCTAIQDVHERHGQQRRVRTAEVAVERQSGLGGSGTSVRERNGEDCVRAELLLVLRPVERNHSAVDVDLIEGVKPDNLRGDALDHVLYRLAYALAEITILVLVARLDRFVLSGGRSARHGRA